MLPLIATLCLVTQTPTPPLPPVPMLKKAKELGLTPTQIKTLQGLQAKYAVEFHKKRQALVESSMEFHKEVQGVLTAEQKVRAKKLKL